MLGAIVPNAKEYWFHVMTATALVLPIPHNQPPRQLEKARIIT